MCAYRYFRLDLGVGGGGGEGSRSRVYKTYGTEYEKINTFLAFGLSDIVFIMLLNVKMPTICWHFNIYEHDKFRDQLLDSQILYLS